MKNLVIVAIIFIIGFGQVHGIAYATNAGFLIYCWLLPFFTTKN